MENKLMGKYKPRHNPDKSQNKIGGNCPYYEGFNGVYWCERGYKVNKCKGNPHNCKKVEYQILASRSDKQKNDDVGITSGHY